MRNPFTPLRSIHDAVMEASNTEDMSFNGFGGSIASQSLDAKAAAMMESIGLEAPEPLVGSSTDAAQDTGLIAGIETSTSLGELRVTRSVSYLIATAGFGLGLLIGRGSMPKIFEVTTDSEVFNQLSEVVLERGVPTAFAAGLGLVALDGLRIARSCQRRIDEVKPLYSDFV